MAGVIDNVLHGPLPPGAQLVDEEQERLQKLKQDRIQQESLYQRLKENAEKVCCILNNSIDFNDVRGISQFNVQLLEKKGLYGDIYVQGPYDRKRSLFAGDDTRPYLTQEKFITRMAPYVDASQLVFERHIHGTYFVVKANGVEQILNSINRKHIFPAENMLSAIRKCHLPSSSSQSDVPFYKFLEDRTFDKNLLDKINRFL